MKMVPIAAMLLASGMPVKEMRPLLETVFQLACMTHATGVGIAAGAVQALALRYCLSGEVLFDMMGSFQALSEEIKKGLFWSYEFADFYDLPIGDWDSLAISVDQRFIRNAILFFSPRRVSCETIARIFRAKGFHAADSIPTVLVFFLCNPFSIETLFDVIHWSGDADSNGAMVGALLGAHNGMGIFPQYLIDDLWQRERIIDTANQLCDVLGIE
jgi:ADP-ribosylglycohydrolase